MKKYSYNLSLLLVVLALVLCSFGGAIWFQNKSLSRAQESVYTVLNDSAAEQAALFNETLNSQIGKLNMVASAITPYKGQSVQVVVSFLESLMRQTDFSRMLVAGPDGIAYTTTGEVLNLSDNPAFKAAIAGKTTVRLSSGLISAVDTEFILSVPIYDSSNQAVGVVISGYDVDTFRNLIISHAFGGSGYSFIVDSEGAPVVGSNHSEYLNYSGNLIELLKGAEISGGSSLSEMQDLMRRGEHGIISYTIDGQQRYGVFQPLAFNNWQIFNVVPAETVDAEVRSTTTVGYFLVGALLIVSILFFIAILSLQRKRSKYIDAEYQKAKATDERIRMALDNTTITIWDYDYKTHSIIQPVSSIAMHGFEPVVANVPESLVETGYVHPDSAQAFLDMYEKLAAGAPKAEGVFYVRNADRTGWWYEHIIYTNIFDRLGRPYRAVGFSEDVSHQKELEFAYIAETQYQRNLSDDIYASVLYDVTEDRQEKLYFHDPEEQKYYEGLSIKDFFYRAEYSAVNDDEVKDFFCSITLHNLEERAATGRRDVEFTYLFRCTDGVDRWMRLNLRLLDEPVKNHLMLFLYLRDVDQQKRKEDELRQAVERDSLTGLLNHAATINHIKRFLDLNDGVGIHALIMLDLDNFKPLNDQLGHQRGDEVLVTVAGIILSVFRTGDIIGRIGGDEFMILIKNVPSLDAVRKKTRELIQAIQVDCSGNGVCLALSGSAGTAVYKPGESFESLYSRADHALYAAKSLGPHHLSIDTGDTSLDTFVEENAEGTNSSTEIIQLHALLENMDGGIMLVEVGEELKVLYISPSFYAVSKLTEADAGQFGQNLFTMIHPDYRAGLEAALRSEIGKETAVDYTYRVLRADGISGWRHIRAVQIPYNKSENPVFIAVITDITELKKSSAMLDAVYDYSPVGIGIFDISSDYKPILANPALLQLVAQSKEKFMSNTGNDIFDLISDADRPIVRAELDSSYKNSRPAEVVFRSSIKTDGVYKYFHAVAVQMANIVDDDILLVMLNDVTKQKNLETMLQESNERLYYAFGQTDALLWEVDIHDRKLRVWDMERQRFIDNPAFDELPESLANSTLVPPQSKLTIRDFFAQLLEGKAEDSTVALIRLMSNDAYGWTRISYRSVLDERGIPIKAIGISKTLPNIFNEQQRYHQELQFQSAIRSRTLGTMLVNLTKNYVELFSVSGNEMSADSHTSYDELFEVALDYVFSPNDKAHFTTKLSRTALISAYEKGCSYADAEYRQTTSDGQIRWVSNTVLLIVSPNSGDLYGFGYLLDINDRRQMETSLQEQSEHDPITRLLTKKTFFSIIDAQAHSSSSEDRCALCRIRIDGLKHIFEEFGHDIEDRLMYTVARLFRILIAGKNLVCRDGENHFLVYLLHTESSSAALAYIQILLNDLYSKSLEFGMPEELGLFATVVTDSCGCSSKSLYNRTLSPSENQMLLRNESGRVFVHIADQPDEETPPPPVPADNSHIFSPLGTGIDLQTGLQNRQSYYAATKNANPDALFAVGAMFIDINGLASLNLNYGDAYGDGLIGCVSKNLLGIFGVENSYRISGDEFVVLQKGIAQEEFVSRCEKFCTQINETYPSLISAGWTWDQNTSSPEGLISHAMERMQLQKSEIRRRAPQSNANFLDELSRWLKDGITRQRFKLYLQPKVDALTKQVVGAEALVRYDDPVRGIISPGQFIDKLEKENIIKHLDFYMLDCTYAVLERWNKLGYPLIPISLNFSRKTLLDESMLENVRKIGAGREALLPYVVIELTESVGDIERAMIETACSRLRGIGYRLSLDDFGSRYSSLYMLCALHFDELKIDKSVIDDIVSNSMSQLIIKSTISMCREMNITSLAEGVETEEQLSVLKELGCAQIQGYFFSKPIPYQSFENEFLSPEN